MIYSRFIIGKLLPRYTTEECQLKFSFESIKYYKNGPKGSNLDAYDTFALSKNTHLPYQKCTFAISKKVKRSLLPYQKVYICLRKKS